jgi:hypothetical protein
MTSRRPESMGSTILFVLIPQHIHAHHPLSRDTLLATTGVCPHTYYCPCDSGRLRAASSKRSTPPQRSGTAVSAAWRAGRQLELTSLSPTNSSSSGLSFLRQSYYDLHWVWVARGTRLLGTFQPPSRDNYDISKPIKGPPTAGAPTACWCTCRNACMRRAKCRRLYEESAYCYICASLQMASTVPERGLFALWHLDRTTLPSTPCPIRAPNPSPA